MLELGDCAGDEPGQAPRSVRAKLVVEITSHPRRDDQHTDSKALAAHPQPLGGMGSGFIAVTRNHEPGDARRGVNPARLPADNAAAP